MILVSVMMSGCCKMVSARRWVDVMTGFMVFVGNLGFCWFWCLVGFDGYCFWVFYVVVVFGYFSVFCRFGVLCWILLILVRLMGFVILVFWCVCYCFRGLLWFNEVG